MGNPSYGKSQYKPYILVFYGLQSPRIPREHNKYHGYTVGSTPNYPLIHTWPSGGKMLLNTLLKWLEFEDGGPLVEAMAMRLPTLEIIMVRFSCLCPYIFSIHLYPGYANMYIIWYLTVCCNLLYHFSLLWKAKEHTHIIFLTWHTWIEKTGHLNAFEFLIWVDIPIPYRIHIWYIYLHLASNVWYM